MATSGLCLIPECSKPTAKRGWCDAHYLRWRRHGDPLGGGTAWGEPRRFFETALNYNGNDCLPWPFSRDGKGYADISFEGKMVLVSRLVCEAVHGPPPTPQHQAAHSCGRGHLACITPKHLSWKTRAENAADKITHDTTNRGERCGTAKLTEDQVREIRALEGTASQIHLAERFSLCQQTISAIQRRRRWAWLDDHPT